MQNSLKEDKMANDATGNEIVMGGRYGYSNRSNGNVTIVIGYVVKINDDRVTLDGTVKGKTVYGDEIERDNSPQRKLSVMANTIFPIGEDVNIAWA